MTRKSYQTLEGRCQQVYRFFVSYYREFGYSPTYEEMLKSTGIQSKGHLASVIEQLIKDHKLERTTYKSRGLKLPNAYRPHSYSLPLLGHIAANSRNPLVLLDSQDSDTPIEVPAHLLPTRFKADTAYVLRVEGNSMSGAKIVHNDFVVIQRGTEYKEGDIVAFYLKDQNAVTLKVYKTTQRGNVKLIARNPKHPTRIEKRENVDIQGRVVAVMRRCVD